MLSPPLELSPVESLDFVENCAQRKFMHRDGMDWQKVVVELSVRPILSGDGYQSLHRTPISATPTSATIVRSGASFK